MRVLVTEDDPTMSRLVCQALTEEGLDVDAVTSGERAIDAIGASTYDLVILDVMLPALDGIATCRRMRDRGATMPVLMLTARDDVDDRVRGLDAGADDHLGKPFSLVELLARVRALLRRGPAGFGARVAYGDLTLDCGALAVRRGSATIELTPRECAIVELLMREHGRVVPRHQILAHAWPEEPDHRSNVLEVLIKRIRGKLGPDTIQTVRGIGYRMRGA